MLYDMLQDDEFRAILKNHCFDILEYLFEKEQEFGVLADVKSISFNPPLPEEIYNAFPEFALFLLQNYTYESAHIEDGKLTFEAGFGPQNFASVVTIPLEAILQIIVDETPIFVNLSASVPKKQKSSLEALMSNPQNRKFFE